LGASVRGCILAVRGMAAPQRQLTGHHMDRLGASHKRMKRCVLVLTVIAMFGPLALLRAATVRRQTSTSPNASNGSSKIAKTSHTGTAHKTSTTRRRRRRRTSGKFVPRQKAPTPERISEIQTALSHGGYYQGDPTGKWDASTVSALQKFQTANGIEPTGKLDAPSLQKLGLGSDIAGVSAPRPPAPVESVPETPANAKPTTAAPAAVSSGAAASSSAAPHPAASISPTAGSLASKPAQQ